jgi:hypothetical protein
MGLVLPGIEIVSVVGDGIAVCDSKGAAIGLQHGSVTYRIRESNDKACIRHGLWGAVVAPDRMRGMGTEDSELIAAALSA